jgi:hypothetical protein
MSSDAKPLMYVDVSIAKDTVKRIALFEHDSPELVAQRFASEHGLGAGMVKRLEALLEEQLCLSLMARDTAAGGDTGTTPEDVTPSTQAVTPSAQTTSQVQVPPQNEASAMSDVTERRSTSGQESNAIGGSLFRAVPRGPAQVVRSTEGEEVDASDCDSESGSGEGSDTSEDSSDSSDNSGSSESSSSDSGDGSSGSGSSSGDTGSDEEEEDKESIVRRKLEL